jgi:hypothetical protein
MVDFKGIKIAVDFDGTIVNMSIQESAKRNFLPFRHLRNSKNWEQVSSSGLSGQVRNLMKL